jgi:molybdopterin-containing oxidoreductase family iron-sulfur binding subunit
MPLLKMTGGRIHISKNYKAGEKQSGKEVKEHHTSNINRRDFIKFIGLSAATLALVEACKKNPVLKNIPAQKLNKKGKINWYSTTCNACTANCHLRVKCNDNIPVKIEGNDSSPISFGGVCAFGQASLLSLYSESRPKEPTIDKKVVSWNDIDREISQKLKHISDSKGKTIILSNTITSPSTIQLINDFIASYPGAEHIMYDTIPSSGILNAHERCFGNRIIPNYQFQKAKVIVSFNTDFLNAWLSPVEYTHKYAATRDIERKLDLSNHIQFESVLTATGAVADDRITIDPSEEGMILIGIYNELATKSGSDKLPSEIQVPGSKYIIPVADLLWKNKGRSVVISANNDTSVQMIVCAVNSILGNYGRTIDINNPLLIRQGNEDKFRELLGRMEIGEIKAILAIDCDPCAESPDPAKFTRLLQLIETSVLISSRHTETSGKVKYLCPANHFLESWNDHHPVSNIFSISQPVISPIFNSRQIQNILLKWFGKEEDFYIFIKSYWMKVLYKEDLDSDFRNFWDNTISDGFFSTSAVTPIKVKLQLLPDTDANYILNVYPKKSKQELVLFESPVERNCSQSDNLWLKEMPDPATKICYDSFCVISPAFAEANDLDDGDYIEISNKSLVQVLPAVIIAGTAPNTVGIPLDKSTFNLLSSDGPFMANHQFSDVSFKKTSGKTKLVNTQKNQQLKKEVYILDFSLEEYFAYPLQQAQEFQKEKKYKNSPHKWVIVVDLNLCTGCSSCVIGCQSENNIPSVGREAMLKNRQMQWLRIDKYYHNQKIHFLPVMCQHCDHAPCEPVCPVSATSHSLEGLNQQNYQRCIGARFCASNCPYDVRRFNFDQYFNNPDINNAFSNEPGKLSINPEVTVRSRGVIEKCSFCIQRIQDVKAKAKNSNKPVIDGNIKTACEQSCPAHAIVFGDMYDKSSRVYHLIRNKRAFTLLPELNTKPSVYYLAKVRKSIFKDV